MSDTPATTGAEAPQVFIAAQYVKDLSFENPRAPHSLMVGQSPLSVAVDVSVTPQTLDATTHEVALRLRAVGRNAEQTLFIAEVSYAGVFVLTGFPEDRLADLLLVEGPRLLFPFARARIADAVSDGGFPPVLINPIDFATLARSATQGANAAGAPGAS